jgi:hypothetical protein
MIELPKTGRSTVSEVRTTTSEVAVIENDINASAPTCWQWTVTCTIKPTLPLGPVSTWTSPSGTSYRATYLQGTNSYVLVDLDPDLAEEVMADLEALRVALSEAAGAPATLNEPKLGLVARAELPGGCPRFRVRQNLEQGMHPGMAASGIVMFAAASSIANTVVAELLGGPIEGAMAVKIPNGETRPFEVATKEGDLVVTYDLSPVATVLIPACEQSDITVLAIA